MPSPAAALTRISDHVRTTRRAMSLTQQELADLAGVSDATVRQIERATGRGTLSSLLAVLGVLGLDLEVRG
ncbi:transcriptional regulator with XRE-family HTH domain [Micrococcus cohnii]|uniref:Transcriptional regulator with XRE-family HTH domain n=2 Tax=Micrococcus cohnii TaxID=993416 RepID=A0A7W7GPR8_9MICC|nr:transcriptional regulator with XRE-family HTH domain [Micrococcus cohnii]